MNLSLEQLVEFMRRLREKIRQKKISTYKTIAMVVLFFTVMNTVFFAVMGYYLIGAYSTANGTDPDRLYIILYIMLGIFAVLVSYLFYRFIVIPVRNIEFGIKNIIDGNPQLPEGKIPSFYKTIYSDLYAMTEQLEKLMRDEYNANILRKQAELSALQSQINPHFLYNTLEAIRGQALVQGATDIERMSKALADFFRYSISKKDDLVTLDQELKNTDSYIVIQQIRFNNKFIIKKQIDPDVLGCMIPKLIIQPIVENAIMHGLELKQGVGTLTIRSFQTQTRVLVYIEDDGLGISAPTLKKISKTLKSGGNNDFLAPEQGKKHIGLANVNNRIKIIFGEEYGIHVYSTKNVGTTVEIALPIN